MHADSKFKIDVNKIDGSAAQSRLKTHNEIVGAYAIKVKLPSKLKHGNTHELDQRKYEEDIKCSIPPSIFDESIEH